jgi:hypothetical protein
MKIRFTDTLHSGRPELLTDPAQAHRKNGSRITNG